MKDRIYVKLIYILVAQRKEKSPLGRNRCRWENNNKMCLRELGCEGEDWIYVAQDLPVVDTVECPDSINGRGVNNSSCC